MQNPNVLLACLAASPAALIAPAVSAGLTPDQVLVIYDSRKPGSVEVAEHYAGSDAVPGGLGGVTGARPGVHAWDLASAGVAEPAANGLLTASAFITRVRDPIRDHLESSGLAGRVRCLVLCKGMPHRIRDFDNANAGDGPTALFNELNAGDASAASVDAELVLLWQDTQDSEAGAVGDSIADGWLESPYHLSSRSVNFWSNAYNRAPKSFQFLRFGEILISNGTTPQDTFGPGDMLLVTRLDGNTAADVKGMIDRAQNVVYDADTAVVVIDESDSNGVADVSFNNELDNVRARTRSGDDFELTRDMLLADGRLDPANINYNPSNGPSNFFVGPLIDYGGEGIVVSGPVALLMHYNGNHAGAEPGGEASETLAEGFTYADGAIFHTVESFNARGFNGQDTRFTQEQLADFVGAGGTFGIGNAFEPLADFIPDLEPVVRNFMLGGLTWAEAAYTGIGSLSWMQIVIGDPLATAHFDVDDVNGDGRFDVDDLYAWSANPVDLNRDGNADSTDSALLMQRLRQREDSANTFGE